MSKKPKNRELTALECHKIAAAVASKRPPFNVWRLFGEKQKTVQFVGADICLGEDYANLEQVRVALTWYVVEFGGRVQWKK